MTRYCPICRTNYSDEVKICPLDGMRLFSRKDEFAGTTIAEHYRLQERIGAGGMAIVYKAMDLRDNEVRAIKILRPELALDSKQRIRFLREVKAARVARHDGIVNIFELGEMQDGNVFFAMEYLDGITLAKRLDSGLLPLSKVFDIILQVLRALHGAHTLGVVHRDIKSENIMLIEDSGGETHIKILDFGLAHMSGDLRLTATGQVFGTPEYISPEQATGGEATPASDQYAAGILFYEMLTGHPPFVGAPGNVLFAQYKSRPVPPSRTTISRPVPGKIDPVVLKMLAKLPRDRYPDAEQAVGGIEELARQVL
jgi:serine/threonine protein kinase